MKQEEKELLLTDISGRLPYGLIVQISLFRNDGIKRDIDLDPHVTENIWEIIDKYHALPYLRPMSSMAEEERKEYKHLVAFSGSPDGAANFIGWLNAHYFDYRGLIERGLAIAVTEENNPYEKEE